MVLIKELNANQANFSTLLKQANGYMIDSDIKP